MLLSIKIHVHHATTKPTQTNQVGPERARWTARRTRQTCHGTKHQAVLRIRHQNLLARPPQVHIRPRLVPDQSIIFFAYEINQRNSMQVINARFRIKITDQMPSVTIPYNLFKDSTDSKTIILPECGDEKRPFEVLGMEFSESGMIVGRNLGSPVQKMFWGRIERPGPEQTWSLVYKSPFWRWPSITHSYDICKTLGVGYKTLRTDFGLNVLLGTIKLSEHLPYLLLHPDSDSDSDSHFTTKATTFQSFSSSKTIVLLICGLVNIVL